MARDDGYLQLMLGVLSTFYLTYVRRLQPPPQDMFWARPEYQRLISRTLEIARGTPLLAFEPKPELPSKADSRLRV